MADLTITAEDSRSARLALTTALTVITEKRTRLESKDTATLPDQTEIDGLLTATRVIGEILNTVYSGKYTTA